jgi:D-alanyl-D-alanine carboxypeptidase
MTGRLRAGLGLAGVALALGAAVVLTEAGPGDRARPSLPTAGRADRPDLQAVLDGLVAGRRRLAPGAVAYVADGEEAWLGSAGFADAGTRAPMPADARLRLESVSKIWTAVLVHQLAEEGALRLSDTVERWLPGLLPDGRMITIGQLLVHRSGLIDNNDVAAAPESYFARVTDPALKAQLLRVRRRVERSPTSEFPAELWIRLAAFQPLLAEPGTLYHYSNIGFEVLGLIAARAGGGSIESLYRERIFAPLGLDDTAYDPQGPIEGPHARGYRVGPDGGLTETTAVHGGVAAEGGLVSSAEETALFLVSLMRGELLGPAQLALLRGDGFWGGGEPPACGGTAYGHSGAGAGFKADVWVSGTGKRVAVLLLNGRGDEDTDARAGTAMRRLYCAAGERDR